MAARCQACALKGGGVIDDRGNVYPDRATALRVGVEDVEDVEEAPCVNVAFYREKYSKDCPRVDLYAENSEAAELVSFLIDERLRPMAPALVDLWGLSAEDRQEVVSRVAAALCDPGVLAIMFPKHEDAE